MTTVDPRRFVNMQIADSWPHPTLEDAFVLALRPVGRMTRYYVQVSGVVELTDDCQIVRMAQAAGRNGHVAKRKAAETITVYPL